MSVAGPRAHPSVRQIPTVFPGHKMAPEVIEGSTLLRLRRAPEGQATDLPCTLNIRVGFEASLPVQEADQQMAVLETPACHTWVTGGGDRSG